MATLERTLRTVGELPGAKRAGGASRSVVSLILHAGGGVFVAVALGAMTNCWHRNDVELEVQVAGVREAEGAGMDVRLRKALEDVGQGSLTGFETDAGFKLLDGEGLPSVMIPHLGVSFATVARWLQFRRLGLEHSRISVTVEELKAGFRVWLAVTPRGGSPGISEHADRGISMTRCWTRRPPSMACSARRCSPPTSSVVQTGTAHCRSSDRF